jgi:serine/threonine-protein kinase
LNPLLLVAQGWTEQRLGHLKEAEAAYRRALEISPTYVSAHYYLGVTLLTEGKAEASLSEMQLETPVGGQLAGLAVAYTALGKTKEAEAALRTLEANGSEGVSMGIAEAYAFRGQKENAFAWLDRAYEHKDIELYYLKGDPLLKNLVGDRRFKSFLRKMNLPD